MLEQIVVDVPADEEMNDSQWSGALQALGTINGEAVVRAQYDHDHLTSFGRVTAIHILEVTKDAYRGLGYGRALLQAVIGQFSQQGIMILWCNEHSARLAEACGFAAVEDPHDVWHDEDSMRSGTIWYLRPQAS